jgi:type I restriction enzyme, S subunit
MSSLPKSWVETNLEKITNITSGIGFPKGYQGDKDGDIGVFKVGEISEAVKNNNGVLKVANNYISFETAKLLGGKIIPVGATIFAKIGEAISLNRRAMVTFPCLIDNNVMSVKSFIDESDKFIHYFLRSIDFSKKSRSTTVPSLRKGDIEEILVPFPPLPEQKRITEKLEQLLERVDLSKARLENVQNTLKRFRQSVLFAATTGKLTEDWRKENGISSNWEVVSIGEITAKVSDGPFGSNLKTEDYRENGIRVVRLENIGHLEFKEDKKTFISKKKYLTLTRFSISPNDILFSSFIDEEIRVCLFPSKNPEIAINKADCFCIQSKSDQCHQEFLLLFLASRTMYESVKKLVHGATRPRINTTQLKQVRMMLPDLSEQLEIVRRVEKLFAFADQLEKRVQTAHTTLERLTPSILAKAFRGELVPQDPTDEPASVLLERIQAARALEAAVPKQRKPRQVKVKSVKTGGNTMKRLEEILSDHLKTILQELNPNGQTSEAKALWQASELSIDEFYLQLSREISAGLLRMNTEQPSIVEAA